VFLERLLDALKKEQLITDSDREAIKKDIEAGANLNDVLSRYKLDDKKIALLKSKILELPYKDHLKRVSLDVLNLIPEEVARQYKILPLARAAEVLSVGMVNPEDISSNEALDFLSRSRGIKIKRFVVPLSEFEKNVKQYSSFKKEVRKALEVLQETKGKTVQKVSKKVTTRIGKFTEATPITKVVHVMMKYAVDSNASDIHIEPLRERVRVRFRVDGVLHASLFLPKEILPSVVSRVKILANLKIDETRLPQDGRIHLNFEGREIDYRVSTFPTIEGEKVVLRVLDVSRGFLSLEELGMSGKSLRDIKRAIRLPYGTTIVTGPTGSGKTTTLSSIMNIINQEELNIVTLEDPVEYYINGVNQSQVNPDIGYTFASGLRHILRQDPNVIMVGEIRDNETAELVTHAALTGHLVFSTLHTNDSVGAIPRIIDMGVDSFLIPSALSLVVAQRLLGKLCDKCKESYFPPERVAEDIRKSLDFLPEDEKRKLGLSAGRLKLFRARGCPECGGKGMKGRIGVFETIYMTRELETIILTEPSKENILQEARRQHMVTMYQDGLIKALQGITSLEEVLRVTKKTEEK